MCADLSIVVGVLHTRVQLCPCCRGRCKGIGKKRVCVNSILTLSELYVWDDGQSFIASKKAYSAHPTAGLPGNAGYGHLIEFPKHSLYGLSNHHLLYNCLSVSTQPYFFFTNHAIIPLWTTLKMAVLQSSRALDIIYLFMLPVFIHISCKAFAKEIKYSVFGSIDKWQQ